MILAVLFGVLALAAWSPFLRRLDPQRRPQRAHPVADPRRGADAGGGPDVRARDHRRRPRRPAGDRPARLRARPAAGARGRRRRPPTTSAAIATEPPRSPSRRSRRPSPSDERRRAEIRRERLRQVRERQPDRAPADGALPRRTSTSWWSRTGAREVHEVGCGEGELAIRLARQGLRVRGTDAFPQVLEEARRRAGDRRGGRDRLRGDAGRAARARQARGGADRLLRGARAPRGPRPRAGGAGGPGPALADRERAARAALARAQPGAARTTSGGSATRRAPQSLVEARLRAVSRPALRGSRAEDAHPVDHGSLPRRDRSDRSPPS